MADNNNSHLWISQERIRVETIIPHPGGDTYERLDLKTHSASLVDIYRKSVKYFETKRDADLASELIVQISTATDRPANKERQHLRNLGFEIISLSPTDPNVVIAKIPRTALPSLSKKLTRYAESPRHIGKSNFAAIEGIVPVGVAQKLDPVLQTVSTRDELIDCLITLYAGLPNNMKSVVAERIVEFLGNRGHEETTIHAYENGTVGVSAKLNLNEMELVSEQFMFVRTIESNSDIIMEASIPADPLPAMIEITQVRCNTPVAVIDSGVITCPLTSGLILETINELPPTSVGPHLSHGTFVASRVIYGDEISNVLSQRASPWCPIIDVQVTGYDEIGNKVTYKGADLGEVLQRVVQSLCNRVKVFNLSLGLTPIKEGYFSSLARLIDFLSRKYKVLFVISAGNLDASVPPPAHFIPESSRILTPGDSLLSLTIGSIAKYSEPGSISREQEISAFSRRGPGADSAMKPELVAHGGNAFYAGTGWRSTPRIAVYGLNRDGSRLDYAIGTSFSAPVVAQYAARLFDAYPQASPNLVRALLCHFTESIIVPSPGAPIESHHFCGFGEPHILQALYSANTSATLLFQGNIKDNTFVFLPFHVPQALAGNPNARLAIKATIVFDPPVSPDDSVQYSLCRIATKLRKRVDGGLRDVSVGSDEDDVLFPWNPILQFSHSFRRGYASGEWELRLRLMTRGDLPEDFLQTYAVAIEIIDQTGGTDVRSSILSEFPGVYVPVRLRTAA